MHAALQALYAAASARGPCSAGSNLQPSSTTMPDETLRHPDAWLTPRHLPPAPGEWAWACGSKQACPSHAGCAAADVNVLKVPEAMTDMSVLLLSDILPTAWHSTEMAEVQKGDRVAIWGAGPGRCFRKSFQMLAGTASFLGGGSRRALVQVRADGVKEVILSPD